MRVCRWPTFTSATMVSSRLAGVSLCGLRFPLLRLGLRDYGCKLGNVSVGNSCVFVGRSECWFWGLGVVEGIMKLSYLI